MNHGEIVSFFWGVADLIRDTFKRGKYQEVILPLTVLRRLDCVLEGTKGKVLETHAKLKGRLDNLDPQLRKASGYAFYNTSRFDFDRLLADAPHFTANLRNYINGFSPNMREVLEPDVVDNPTMGTIFEELVRKLLTKLPTTLYKDRAVFLELLLSAAKKADLKLPAPVQKAILSALSEHGERPVHSSSCA
jgi:type I restriction enzyme M protein